MKRTRQLTDDHIRRIRWLYAHGRATQAYLATQFCITQPYISQVVRRIVHDTVTDFEPLPIPSVDQTYFRPPFLPRPDDLLALPQVQAASDIESRKFKPATASAPQTESREAGKIAPKSSENATPAVPTVPDLPAADAALPCSCRFCCPKCDLPLICVFCGEVRP